MARPSKKGLEYFELDCVIDDKVKLLIAEFVMAGYGTIIRLYQKIYGEEGYYCHWDKDVALLFCQENGMGRKVVSEIINACIRRGLFDCGLYQRCQILTSKGIQKRYFRAASKKHGLKIVNDYLLIDMPKNTVFPEETPVIPEITPVNDEEMTQTRLDKTRKEDTIVSSVKSLGNAETLETEIALPLKGGKKYSVKSSQVEEWSALYPAVDVRQQLRNMLGWLNANPDRQKTSKGILRFITGWLAREQQNSGFNRTSKNSVSYEDTMAVLKGLYDSYEE